MLADDAELLSTARQYKAELIERMFGIRAQTASAETQSISLSWSLDSNVVGIGFGLRATNNSSPPSERALRIYVRKKLPQSSLSAREIVPKAINGVSTDVITVGDIVALTHNSFAHPRPTQCGVSVGHYQVSAGTLGCLVKRINATTDERYILSNNHVLANCNHACIGDPILHPGSRDGGNLSNPIAELTEFEELHAVGSRVNMMDAAIAKVLNCDEVLPEIRVIGAVQQPEFVSLQELQGRQVCKYGRTTGLTRGTVGDVSADILVTYHNDMRAHFQEQITIDWGNEPFSKEGDSGSLIVDCATQRPIALLFAGGSKAGSYATPIKQIITRFQIEIL